MAFADAAGRVSAALIALYPPGVPVLSPLLLLAPLAMPRVPPVARRDP
ncbi:MAG: hypothetical protein ABI323_05285 [Solirubrobacteraceae bacterium]